MVGLAPLLPAEEPLGSLKAEAAPSKKHLLKQILIATTPEAALKLSPVANSRLVVFSGVLSALNASELEARLDGAKDRPIEPQMLSAIAQVVEIYVRQHGFPIIEGVTIPTPQNIADGTLRLSVGLGKFREIKFLGNHWFSESLLRGSLHVAKGEIIQFADLDQAIGWTNNNNPFRRIQVRIDPVPNSGQADLIIGVQERVPLRLIATVDDAGNDVLGRNHYSAALTYANLWGLDHQVTYQYITTNHGQYFQGHLLSYRAPLPWRHYLQFNATYMRARPDLLGGFFNQDAENISGELRYTIPLRGGDNPAEWYAALNFKESNNDLQFGGTSVQNSKTDIFELTTGASKVLRDKRGAWAFGATANFSPGHINSRNSDTAFVAARAGTKSAYSYGGVYFQRLLTLDRGWELNSRANLQVSDRNLLSSEALTVGGSSTVRGFNENVFAADEGFVLNNDLLLPALRQPVHVLGKDLVPLETRFLAFYDAANVRNKHTFTYDPAFKPLASTGVGVRINWASNFSASFDYGWQITHLPVAQAEDIHGRGHLKVTLAY